MSTLLTLVQDLWRESGSGGQKPTDVVGAGGESLRLVGWIRRADLEIQSLYSDWDFLWVQRNFPTVQGQFIYPRPDGLVDYDEKSFLLDGVELEEVYPYLEVKGQYRDTQEGKPYQVIVMPDKSLRLDQTPNGVFTITHDYWLAPRQMDLDNGAESVIPKEFQDVIVARALMHYARYEGANELIPTAQDMYTTWLKALEARWLPGERRKHLQAEGGVFEVQVE